MYKKKTQTKARQTETLRSNKFQDRIKTQMVGKIETQFIIKLKICKLVLKIFFLKM